MYAQYVILLLLIFVLNIFTTFQIYLNIIKNNVGYLFTDITLWFR